MTGARALTMAMACRAVGGEVGVCGGVPVLMSKTTTTMTMIDLGPMGCRGTGLLVSQVMLVCVLMVGRHEEAAPPG